MSGARSSHRPIREPQPLIYNANMIPFLFVAALVAGLAWTRRRKRGNIVRIPTTTPFPPYDWFAKEQSPEEPFPPRRGSSPAS
jgi:hypothetical protein